MPAIFGLKSVKVSLKRPLGSLSSRSLGSLQRASGSLESVHGLRPRTRSGIVFSDSPCVHFGRVGISQTAFLAFLTEILRVNLKIESIRLPGSVVKLPQTDFKKSVFWAKTHFYVLLTSLTQLRPKGQSCARASFRGTQTKKTA